ncbi:MAG: hypothetical protein ACYCTW_11990 [Sulfuricella sp.]
MNSDSLSKAISITSSTMRKVGVAIFWVLIAVDIAVAISSHMSFSQILVIDILVLGASFAVLTRSAYLKINENKLKTEVEKRESARIAEAARLQAHKDQQEATRKELINVNSNSLQSFESLPEQLSNAEQFLDQAERDYQENAFAPFWNTVELATMQLGGFDNTVARLAHFSQRHEALSKTYEATAPRFPINVKSVGGMAAAVTTTDRMKTIVRKAQTNFQFAMIYEQRKTNQLLVAGFTNLAQALDGMSSRIASSIDELGGNISAMSSAMQESFSTLGQQIQTSNQQIVESVDALHSTSQQNAADDQSRHDDANERHDRALEMLDNIQRHRKPTGFYMGVGTEPAT